MQTLRLSALTLCLAFVAGAAHAEARPASKCAPS